MILVFSTLEAGENNTFKILKEMFSNSEFYIQPNYKAKVKKTSVHFQAFGIAKK